VNKIITRFAPLGFVLIAAFVVVLGVGCGKDKPCNAIVTVLDASNNPVGGAVVHLVAPAPSVVDIFTSSGTDGKATFEVSLPQILDIQVWIGGFPMPPTGKVVRFEQGKTDEVTVNL
jgi:hypothetical protein